MMHILELPEKCYLQKKLTKTFFKRNFDLTSTEKNLLDDPSDFVAMLWLAAINPLQANVPTWISEEATFEEIQVIVVKTSPEGLDETCSKIIDLVQKYIPYHCILVLHDDERFVWNVAYKKINQNLPTKRITHKKFTTPPFLMNSTASPYFEFLQMLRFSQVTTTHLKDLYDSYVNCFVSLQIALLVGGIFKLKSLENLNENILCLEQITQLEKDINRLIEALKKETQLNIRIEVNLQIQTKKTRIQDLKIYLSNN